MGMLDTAVLTGDGDALAARQLRAFAAHLSGAVRDAGQLSEGLCQLIALQAMEAGRVGGRGGADVHLQARYLKAALADELLLHVDWSGRAHWHHVLVEARLFESAHAGERVFADIDTLLRERDPAQRALARLYLLLLAYGFQGRYRGGASLDALADYRRALFEFVYQRSADLGGRDAVLSEQPYASTLVSGAGARLSRPSRRGVGLALALLCMLGLSEALWLWQSWPVREALEVHETDDASAGRRA